MNKLTIKTNDKALTVRMSDTDAEVWFGTLCRALLGDYADIAAPASADTADVADVAPATADDELEADAQLPVLTPSVAPADDADPQGYKGFLHIKCKTCGEVAAYCVNHPRIEHSCQACGAATPLLDLHKATFACECGNKWVYRTNETDRMIEQACLRCGAPMTAEQDKNGDYWPLR
ncbi:MAG: hypothetical protein SO044_00675 [Agathobaculum sp.]|uniref:hypothetical protein n=1 Tax=Agathobaculum sp. TaxID=2048138 RepID=UPI002A83D0C9|nr:hypothetical protein [Agathobaculum sp.]MDY3710918.1 hypothetical protein [Agathobaculum sp.]